MRPVSDTAYYLDHFVSQTAELDIAPVNGTAFTVYGNQINQGSLKINEMCAVGDVLKVGTVIAPDMTVTITGAWMFNNVDLNGAAITVRCKTNANGTPETFHLGTFYADEVTVDNDVISIRALGEIVKMDKLYHTGDIAFPLTVGSFTSSLCSKCGFVLHPLGAALDDLVNTTVRDMTITEEPEDGKYTYRQLLGYCAQAMGVNAYITKELVAGQYVSKVRLRWFRLINKRLNNSRLFSVVIGKNHVEPTGAAVRNKHTVATYGSMTNAYDAGYNPLTDNMTQAEMQNVAYAIYSATALTSVYSFSATTMPAPFLEPMDAVEIVDNENTVRRGFISSVSWEPNVNTRIQGAGFPISEEDDFSPFTKEQDDILDGIQTQTNQNQSDIQEAQTKLSSIDDYIVSSGEENGFVYRKWNSGISECWGIVSVTGAWTSFLDMYMKTGSKRFPTDLFSETPCVQISAQGSENTPGRSAFWVGAQTNQHSSTGVSFALFRPSEGTSTGTYYVSVHAIGKYSVGSGAIVGSAIVGQALISE